MICIHACVGCVDVYTNAIETHYIYIYTHTHTHTHMNGVHKLQMDTYTYTWYKHLYTPITLATFSLMRHVLYTEVFIENTNLVGVTVA